MTLPARPPASVALLALSLSCAPKGVAAPSPAPPPAAPADVAPAPTPPSEAGPGASLAACQAGQPLLTRTVSLARAPDEVVGQLVILDTGGWTSLGADGGGSGGCLADEEVAQLQAAIEGATIAAPPLGPGMARCMALPATRTTVEAGDATATWDAPCGGQVPDPSLIALLQLAGALTGAGDSSTKPGPTARPPGP